MRNLLWVFALSWIATTGLADSSENGTVPAYEVRPIGWVRKTDGRTTIEVDKQYQPALLGVDELDAIWVLYWFTQDAIQRTRCAVCSLPAHRCGLILSP